jgi:hypothetical protein
MLRFVLELSDFDSDEGGEFQVTESRRVEAPSIAVTTQK